MITLYHAHTVFLNFQDTSNTHRDAILQQACYDKQVWDQATIAMDMFAEFKLKGQKLNQKSLIAKPEFKQQYLAPLRALRPEDQFDLLTKLTGKKITLSELKTEAQQIKSMQALKATFVRLTNMESWDVAMKQLPFYASEEHLSRFIQCDLRKSIPSIFLEFCLKAKR